MLIDYNIVMQNIENEERVNPPITNLSKSLMRWAYEALCNGFTTNVASCLNFLGLVSLNDVIQAHEYHEL